MSGSPSSIATLALHDLGATARLGAALARRLATGDVVALHGDLGAGKSELARAIVRAAAGDDALIVPSPTFTLAETYDTARGPVWHFDLYRLDSPEQVWELGFEEALADGISLVEWPGRLGDLLPADCLHVGLSIAGDDVRDVSLAGPPSWAARLAGLDREIAHG